MNDRDQETKTWRSPLIFTVPAYGFVMALYLDSLGRSSQAISTKTRRWLSDKSTENEEISLGGDSPAALSNYRHCYRDKFFLI